MLVICEMAIRRSVIKGYLNLYLAGSIFLTNKTTAMKKLMITLFFGGFLILFNSPHACAGGDSAKAATMETVKTEVTKQIPYPAFAMGNGLTAKVDILFHVNSAGTIQVVRVLSKEGQLAQYVKQQLEGLQLDLPVQGQNYQMTVDFVIR